MTGLTLKLIETLDFLPFWMDEMASVFDCEFDVDLIELSIDLLEDFEFESCKACYACKTPDRECFQEDEISIILDDMVKADIIVYATPIYYYSMCGTQKMFIDRCYPIFRDLENKEYYIITAAGASNGDALKGIEDFIAFSKNPNIKEIFSGFGDVKNQKDLLKEVYDAGKNC